MPQKSYKEYSEFSFEDFLQDDFFIVSMKYPTEDSQIFWAKFLQEHKESLENFHAARQFIEDVNKSQLQKNEIAGMWNGIKASNTRMRRRRIYYVSSAVAAGIALLLILRFNFYQSPPENVPINKDIMSYATMHQEHAEKQGETQLVVSDKKSVVITEKESIIKYDTVAIKVSDEEISQKESAPFNQLIVPIGKRSRLTFHDGTEIWVNAGTRVVYPATFDKNKREIYVDGEVYLNVVSNNDWPFIVRTNDINIQVLGTKFNVQAYSLDTQKKVALESGSIKIATREHKTETILSPDKLYVYESGKESVTDADIRKYTSWIDGLYIYESEKLDVILARLSRYYGCEIEVDQVSAKLQCTGKLDLKSDLDNVLTGLIYTAPVSFNFVNGKYIITHVP